MKIITVYLSSIILLMLSNNLVAQDTLLLHYENASISEAVLDSTGTGYITGKGNDLSRGKFMYFDSYLHKSPETRLLSVLMDLEVSDFIEQDSFTVFVERAGYGNTFDKWEKKFSFADIESTSKLIAGGVEAYNFEVDVSDRDFFNVPYLTINVGITYDYNSNAKIALRATDEGEFLEANSRCFTINKDESISNFVDAYNSNVGLAIFPVTFFSTSTNNLKAMGFQVINTNEGTVIINSGTVTGDFEISLFSVDGKLMKQNHLLSGASIQFDTSNIPSGIYILNASNNQYSTSEKIFVR